MVSYNFRPNLRVVPDVKEAAARGLAIAADHVYRVAANLAPIEEGTLARSGGPSVDQGKLTAAISFDTPYAARQHEELHWRHDSGKQAKFLESAMNSEKDAVTQIIADTIRGEI